MSLPQRKTRPQRQKVRPRDDKIAESLYHDKRHKSDSLRLVLEVHQADSAVEEVVDADSAGRLQEQLSFSRT